MAKQQKKTPKEKKISYHRQPEAMTLREWQIGLRRQFGKKQTFELVNEGDHPVWSDFRVLNVERNSNYRLALRGQEPGENFCSCMDYKVSGLGTCKHIEWALEKLYNTYGNKQHFRKPPPERTYTSVYLEYRETRRLRIRIGAEEEAAFQLLATQYFDEEGYFYDHAYLDFHTFLAKAKALSDRFRCYPDALEWILEQRAKEFLDQFLLGPLYLLQYRHLAKNDNGMVVGYRRLDEIYNKLKDVMLRRRKKDVLKQLPPRVDKNLFVPMTGPQWALHQSYDADVAQLVAKWRRQNFLSEQDRLRLMGALQMMRMSCNSTYIVDLKNRHDTKVDELFYILEERLSDPQESVVIFSQWSRMTHLVASELEAREIPFAHLHGGVPSTKRGELLDRFREDAECRVFLSTDAGGVGLNLQKASLIVNLDLPWNPAVLEQRIGRVYRLGQERGVQVINLVAENTIEHRMLYRLKFKSSLAEAVLDTAEEAVFMDSNKMKKFIEELEQVRTTDQESTPTEAEQMTDENLEQQPAETATEEFSPSIADNWWEEETIEEVVVPEAEKTTPTQGVKTGERQATASGSVKDRSDAQALLSQGMQFLSRLTDTLRDPQATQKLVQSLAQKDEETQQTYLKIPVESEAIVQNAMQLLGGLLGQLNR